MSEESQIRQELDAVEGYLARLTEHAQKVEGRRDELLLKLADNEGAHDRRAVGVR